jgi:hypothetical protein
VRGCTSRGELHAVVVSNLASLVSLLEEKMKICELLA